MLTLVGEWAAQGLKVAWLFLNEERALRVDSRLWTFDDSGFLAHSLLGRESHPLDSLVLVIGNRPPAKADIVLNFTQDPVPEEFLSTSSGRVYDFIDASTPEGERLGRTKWNWYKKAGVELGHASEVGGLA